MSTIHAGTRLTPPRRVTTGTKPAYGPSGHLARAVVALAALIAGGDR